MHIDPVPSGDSPYGVAYLVSAEVDLVVFCRLEVSPVHLEHNLKTLSEVVPLYPEVEELQIVFPETSFALRPPSLTSSSPRQTFFHLLIYSLSNDDCPLAMAAYCLHNRHPVEHAFLPLLLYVDLNPYSLSLPAAPVRGPCGSPDYFLLGLLSLLVFAVAPLPEGPSL